MYRLYDYLPSGNGYKVRLVLKQLALPYELIELDIRTGATRTADFLDEESQRPHPAAGSAGQGLSCRRVTRSSAFLAEGSRADSRRSVRARTHVAVDVLRAVQPRAEHRDAALLDEARQDARGARREAGREKEERLRGARRARGDAARSRVPGRASSTRWRTLRCTRTRTSRTKAASISRRIRRSAPGASASQRAARAGRRLPRAQSQRTAAAPSSRSCGALPGRRARALLPAADRLWPICTLITDRATRSNISLAARIERGARRDVVKQRRPREEQRAALAQLQRRHRRHRPRSIAVASPSGRAGAGNRASR